MRCGDRARAAELLDWAQHLRGDDAAYWTGANFTDGCIFPPDEQPTWTAAAVVLAANAISGGVVATLLDATPLALPARAGCPRGDVAEAVVERAQVHVEGCLAAVGGVGEDVVDDQQAARARGGGAKPE